MLVWLSVHVFLIHLLVLCMGSPRSQELSSGASVWVGGFESVDRACHEGNEMGFGAVLDCRGLFPLTRRRRRHDMNPQQGVEYSSVSQTKLGMIVTRRLFEQMMEPVLAAVSRRQRVLVACVNGRHRSAQLAALLVLGAQPQVPGEPVEASVDRALNHVWQRRHLTEWTHPSGSRRCFSCPPPRPSVPPVW